MASTFSPNLSIELIGTGDQAGTWGTTTNSNLGTLIEQAISGYVTQAVATGTDTTITIPNGSTGVARNMYIELTGTGGTNTNLIVPANKKLYFIFNNSTGAVTVKVSGQTGVSVPTGKKMVLVSNGTDIVNGLNYIADFGTNSFSVTNLTASSATITNLIATSGSITNLVSSDASATVLRAGSATLTHLSATSASITNLTLTSLVISNLSIASANITTLTGSTQTLSGNLTLSGGTANGVLYLNGSKVATSGSGFTYDGTTFALGAAWTTNPFAGTTAPVYFQYSASSNVIRLAGDSGVGFAAFRFTNDGGAPSLQLGKARGTYASPSAVQTGDNLGDLQFRGYGGTNSRTLANVTAFVETYTSDSNISSYLEFRTSSSGSASATEKMRLTAAGDLGIGTASPTQKLHVVGDGNFTRATATDTFIQASNSVATFNITQSANGSTYLYNYGAYNLYFGTNSATRMTLDSSGNLGIGTASPGAKLQVIGTTSDQIRVGTAATEHYRFGRNASDGLLDFYGSQTGFQGYRFGGIDGTWAVINSSGNLGLGVTPSVWSSGKAFEMSAVGNGVWCSPDTYLIRNCYYNGGWKYASTAAAANYYIDSTGQHIWSTAASGTAGNAISFTQAMTLTSGGKLLVGRTTDFAGEALQIDANGVGATVYSALIGNSSTSTSVYNVLRFNQGASGSATGMIGTGGSAVGNNAFANNFVVGTQTSNALVFATNDTERARITSGGNLLVGTTTAGAGVGYDVRLAVDGGAAEAGIFKTSGGSSAYSSVFWNTATTGNNLFALFGTEASITTRGSISYNRAGGLVAYNTTSDYRAKDILGPVQNSGATIDALKVYEGQMKGATQSRPMLVAHEAQEHAPYTVTGEKDAVNEDGTPNYQQMDVSALVPLLLAEVQSLRKRVAELESK